MIWIKLSKKLNRDDVKQKIAHYEKKYGMPVGAFEKKVVNGHEEELDERGVYPEYEEWKYYSEALKKKELPEIIESEVKPLVPEFRTALVEVFTQERLRILDVLNERRVASITQLSQIVKRDKGSVSYDLRILEKAEIIELKHCGKIVTPVPKYNKVAIEF